ncbi:hypothetical protein PoB_000328700 [Plakobranchus ocellatus]|uniref:Laminin G domain-containing protein n=1 Tax=Plakobranchus ocellatus TaxID=259542 RepID=A0AAV3Y2W1_9GAST|nr:hypothetical protein PoB_000328700 [Plakobranchus ocellatus]
MQASYEAIATVDQHTLAVGYGSLSQLGIDLINLNGQVLYEINGSKVKLQKAPHIKVSQDNPEYYFIAYNHKVNDAWQIVRIGRPGAEKPVQPQALDWEEEKSPLQS